MYRHKPNKFGVPCEASSAQTCVGRMSMLERHGNEVVRKRTKRQVCEAYLNKMLARPDISHLEAGFTDRLKRHFDLLPTRYALDINLETLDVLNHMQLLEEARSDPSAVFFHVRIVEILLHSSAHSPNEDAEGIMHSDMDTDQVWTVLPLAGRGRTPHACSPTSGCSCTHVECL